MIIDGLIVGGSVLVAALGGWGVWLWLRSDDRRAGFTQPDHPGFGDITPETVHKAPWPPAEPPPVTLCDALHRQYPLTSPAAPPPGAEQGTAAAAGGLPGSPPPPLPDPAYAAAHPGCWPLGWLEDDQFVTDWTDLLWLISPDGVKTLAETEALVKASYYKPLDGA